MFGGKSDRGKSGEPVADSGGHTLPAGQTSGPQEAAPNGPASVPPDSKAPPIDPTKPAAAPNGPASVSPDGELPPVGPTKQVADVDAAAMKARIARAAYQQEVADAYTLLWRAKLKQRDEELKTNPSAKPTADPNNPFLANARKELADLSSLDSGLPPRPRCNPPSRITGGR